MKFSERTIDRLFFGTALILLLVKISGELIEIFPLGQWASFYNPTIVFPFIAVLTLHAILFVIAINFSTLIHIPASFIYLTTPLGLYVVLLLNSLTFNYSDQYIVIAFMIVLTLGVLLFSQKTIVREKNKVTIHKEWWIYIILSFFIAHAALLFLSQNFRLDRLPFSDENSFWYVASFSMLDQGFLNAHTQGYPGGGLHPFGVPVISSFPGLFFNLKSPFIPFFMPIYILGGLTLILSEIVSSHKSRWAIVFFLTVWFASFHNRSWAGVLMYSMVYGESVCALLVISVLLWLIKDIESDNVNLKASSFFIGLLALTKYPLVIMSGIFFISWLIKFRKKIPNMFEGVKLVVLFLLPFFFLKMFQIKYGGNIGSVSGPASEIFQNFFAPNFGQVFGVLKNISFDVENLGYCVVISLLFSLSQPRQWKYAWPICVWIIIQMFYYLYTNTHASDTASGIRYSYPAAAGLLLLGAGGFANLLNSARLRFSFPMKFICYFICLYAIFYKVF